MVIKSRSNTGGTSNQNPTPPPAPVSMENIMTMQTQILQEIVQTMTSFQQAQAQQMQASPRNKYVEFMKCHPPVFAYSLEPLEAEDWLKSVERHLEIAECNDKEKVLYASGQLRGVALDWWEFYTSSHTTPTNITWQEFKDSFRSHHMLEGLINQKKEEFLSLKQGSMSVIEYRDKFIRLSRYMSWEVNTDERKRYHFMEGLNLSVQYMLVAHSFDNFQQLVNKALVVENKLHEIVKKRRMAFQSQEDSSSHNYLMTELGPYFFPEDQYEKTDQAQPQEGHFIRQCPNKRLRPTKRKAMTQNFVDGGN